MNGGGSGWSDEVVEPSRLDAASDELCKGAGVLADDMGWREISRGSGNGFDKAGGTST